MNFFGHAVVASWFEASAAFGFGAMLPDLTQMLGLRQPLSSDAQIQRGVLLHHATDRVFHSSRHFLHFQAEARRALAEDGVAKGARLAIAHVGVELILDAHLSMSRDNLAAYERALTFGSDAEAFEWRTERNSEAPRSPSSIEAPTLKLRRLATTLLLRKEALAPRNGIDLAERLERILDRRPALRPEPELRHAVARWGDTAFLQIEGKMGSWMQDIRSRLDGLRIDGGWAI